MSKQLTTTPFKTFASAYLQRGWFIFPLRPNGKEPITPNGFKDASNDLEVIENWIRRYPSSNIGIATEASNPTHEHMAKALMVLSYLFETKDMEMTHCCNGEDPRRLLAFVDASYAIHKDMKGHTGALIFDELLNLFFSSSSKHKMMGKSSTDAEIIGAHATMNTIELLKALHQELTGSNEPAILFQDNLSAKFLMENGDSASDKSKHMKIRYFYIKEKVDEKVVEIQYRKTERMWADLLTKPISNKRVFKLMRSKMMNFQPGDVYYVSE